MKSNKKNSCNNEFIFKVFDENRNLIELKSDDPILTGQQILEKAGKYQTDNYMLIQQQTDGMLEEINLSESVNLAKKGVERFFVFESDRIHYFKLNGRKMPWGNHIIDGAQLRELGNIPEAHQLFLQEQSKVDSIISDDAIVDLDNPGLEKIYSKEQKEFEIIINGKPKRVSKSGLTFLEIIQLAFPKLVITSNTECTVTYTRGCIDNPEGSLVKGESVCIKDGEVFNASATDKS